MYSIDHPKRQKLFNKIKDWNLNRLDIFYISEPDENLEYFGVMRFFYQDNDLKYQSKCLRVSSTATTSDVVSALVLKFHPNKKVSINDYALYESYSMNDRKMKENEHPLVVQLNWVVDDRDGKFILKNERRRRRSTDVTNRAIINNNSTISKSTSSLFNSDLGQTTRSQSSAIYNSGEGGNNKDNFFSKHFSTLTKSRRKSKQGMMENGQNVTKNEPFQTQLLYDQRKSTRESKVQDVVNTDKLPESSFTRTISNPDEVMKRRRQKKLESRLEQFSGIKGNSETGGTLKIYGDSINQDIPYKTLLLSVNDAAEKVLAETLEKYGLSHQDQRCYVLVQQNIVRNESYQKYDQAEEIILHDQDCPLGILVKYPPKPGSAVTFSVRRRTPQDKDPLEPRVPPFAITKDLSPGIKNDQNISDDIVPEFQHNVGVFQNYPRLMKLTLGSDGNMYENESEIYSLSALIKNSESPGEVIKFIKIGSSASSVGEPPNILLSSKVYPDIRPTHCHISAKQNTGNNYISLQLVPTLDIKSKSNKNCLVYINRNKVEKTVRLKHEDYIQLGEFIMFKYEEYEDEESVVGNTSGNVLLEQMRQVGSLDEIQMDYLTADLPISIQYDFKKAKKVISRILTQTRSYVEKCNYELFGCDSQQDEQSLNATFRLFPAYALYLIMRAGLGDEKYATQILDYIAVNIDKIIEEDKNYVEKEVFWLSNASELLHLVQCDRDLRKYSNNAQEVLATSVEHSFSYIQNQLTQDIYYLLPCLLQEEDYFDLYEDPGNDNIPCNERASILVASGISLQHNQPVQLFMQTLSFAQCLFSNCQVNLALTIQMFSQLFHFINCWLANSVLGNRDSSNAVTNLDTFKTDYLSIPLTQEWGERLQHFLDRILTWSEYNGLDNAANSHMQQIYQIVELLQEDKTDMTNFGNKCLGFIKINPVQLNELLYNLDDCSFPESFIDVVTKTAWQLYEKTYNESRHQNQFQMDPNTNKSYENVKLHEDLDLRLPLLLPADGYCCDRGICSCPTELRNILFSLEDSVKHRLNPPIQDTADTRWKAYLGNYDHTPSVSRSNTVADQVPVSPSGVPTTPSPPPPPLHNHQLQQSSSYLPQQKSQQRLPRQQLPINDEQEISQTIVEVDHQQQIELSESDTDKNLSNSNRDTFHGDVSDRYSVKLKKINNSLGLSIVAARANQSEPYRIYIKDVIENGAGYKNGKIQSGDQLVCVNDTMLVDLGQEDAVELIKKTGSTVTLVMEKGAAQKHGVAQEILQTKAHKNPMQPKLRNKNNQNVSSEKGVKSNAPKDSGRPVKEEVMQKKPQHRGEFALPSVPDEPPRRHLPKNDKNKHSNPKIVPHKQRAPITQKEKNAPVDYNSLPIRNRQKPVEAPVEKYSTVRNRKTIVDTNAFEKSRPKSAHASSQPDLYKPQMHVKQKRPVESDRSSSSGSYSTTDEETDEFSETKHTVNSRQKQIPSKSVSDMNINKNKTAPKQTPLLYGSETEISKRPGPKKAPLLTRPVMKNARKSESSSSSEDDSKDFESPPEVKPLLPEKKHPTNIKPEKPTVPLHKNIPVSKVQKTPITQSAADDETDSTESYTESSTSTEMSKKIHVKNQLANSVNYNNNNNNNNHVSNNNINSNNKNNYGDGKEEAVIKANYVTKVSADIQLPVQVDSSPKPIHVPVAADKKRQLPSNPNFSSNKSMEEPQISDTTINPQFEVQERRVPEQRNLNGTNLYDVAPPPKPTASHPQYHPPSKLQENLTYSSSSSNNNNNNNNDNSNNSQPASLEIEMQKEQQIKLRKKAMEEKIRRETDERIKQKESSEENSHSESSKRRSDSDMKPQTSRDSVIKYGRPQFSDNSKRPLSLHQPNITINNDADYKTKGVVVEASPPPSQNVLGTREVYVERRVRPIQLENKSDQPKEPAENLSFRDKMKLFAQKNGEDDVVLRTRFSSKQRQIESGNYN